MRLRPTPSPRRGTRFALGAVLMRIFFPIAAAPGSARRGEPVTHARPHALARRGSEAANVVE